MCNIDLKKRSSYDYKLPEELIAQFPLKDRSSSRLLVLDKNSGLIEHKSFNDIDSYFRSGDVLVVNATKVIPARLLGHKETGAKVEVFLLNHIEDNRWKCLVKPGRKLKVGTKVIFNDYFTANIVGYAEDGERVVEFESKKNFWEAISEVGNIPLPPYIKREAIAADSETYQTIYAKIKGSVAAPTAGLHFTDEVMNRLKNKGVIVTEVILHVGLGTFRPVAVENIEEHAMHSEFCIMPQKSAEIINQAKDEGRRIFAVGTTSTRTLESFAEGNHVVSGEKWTNIFIYPGKKFNIIDAQITNFHMPESTLLMMISAFAGYDKVMNAYKEAVKEKYRFFSYGDAMLIK